MLRLWPETITAGLFPGYCWVRRGAVRTAGAADGAPDMLLAELGTLLSRLPAPGKRPRNLHLVVSDGLAAVTQLPWQEKLTSKAELAAYASACYERQGDDIDDTWATQTGFRHFGAAGLAYALPQAWLRQLKTVADQSGATLKTVLPVSAAAYWRRPASPGGGQSVLLLNEARRLTGLVYEAGRLARVDVQPVTQDPAVAGTRLLTRLVAGHGQIRHVGFWSAAEDSAVAPPYIQFCLPDAAVTIMPAGAWS